MALESGQPRCKFCGHLLGGGPEGWYSRATERETCDGTSVTTFHEPEEGRELGQPAQRALNELAALLHELWSAERCDIELRYDPSYYGNPPSWVVRLTWVDEHSADDHRADFMTFDWQFYGDTADEAMREATTWVEALHAWGEALDAE